MDTCLNCGEEFEDDNLTEGLCELCYKELLDERDNG